MGFLDAELLARFLGVLAIDLILSGDNAVVIALAVRQLEGKARRRAIFFGAGGAVALRLLFAAVVTFLLRIPLLRAVGGVLLLWISWRLTGDETGKGSVRAGGSIRQAVGIIIVADLAMSFDNVVALVGVSGGNLWLLVFGLALTIPLIIWGSTLLSRLMDRFWWLVYAGAAVLVYVAVEMIFEDPIVHGFAGEALNGLETLVGLAFAAAFVAFALWRRRAR